MNCDTDTVVLLIVQVQKGRRL